MKDFREFAEEFHPGIEKQYELYCMTDEELIGKKVVSIRSGYSGLPGTKMIIEEILPPYRPEQPSPEWDQIKLIGRDGDEEKSGLGWMTPRKDLINSIKLDQ